MVAYLQTPPEGSTTSGREESGWNMIKAMPLLVLAVLAGGCAETVTAQKFLYMYRRGASPGHMEEGWYADHTGRDDKYHYQKVQYSTMDRGADQILRYGAFREDILRCPLGALPYDFPDGFRRAYQDGRRVEPEEATYRYIREYLDSRTTTQPAGDQPATKGISP